jgi:hypothetical protein
MITMGVHLRAAVTRRFALSPAPRYLFLCICDTDLRDKQSLHSIMTSLVTSSLFSSVLNRLHSLQRT